MSIKQELIKYCDWLSGQPVIEQPSQVVESYSDTNVIEFTYSIEDVFEAVKMHTAIRAKTIRTKEGIAMIDDYTITNDERTWFDAVLKQGASRVHNVLTPLHKNLSLSFIYNEGVVIVPYNITAAYPLGTYVRGNDGRDGSSDDDVYKSLSFIPASNLQHNNILTNPDKWELQSPLVDTKGHVTYLIESNENIPESAYQMIDNCITEALQLYILKQWYKIVGLMEEVGLKEQEYTECVLKIRSNSYLRIFPIARKSRPFG